MIFYLSLVTNTFDVLDCVGSSDNRQLAVEPSIRCSDQDSSYSKLQVLSYISFVVYVAGIPLLVLGCMLWSRVKLKAGGVGTLEPEPVSPPPSTVSTARHQLGKNIAKEVLQMTSKQFRPQYYYWTLVLLLRNLVVILLIRTVPSDGELISSLPPVLTVLFYFLNTLLLWLLN